MAQLIQSSQLVKSLKYLNSLKLLRKPEVLNLTKYSKSTLHVRINNGLMTTPIAISTRSVAFPEHEVLAIIAAQISGKNDDEIRLLVKELVAQRQFISLGEQL